MGFEPISQNFTMNILGKIEESASGPKEIDKAGLLKILRLAIMVGIAAALGALLAALPGFDLIPGSTIDETAITLFLIPGVEALRRYIVDYSQA
jgi:hypothetical protein